MATSRHTNPRPPPTPSTSDSAALSPGDDDEGDDGEGDGAAIPLVEFHNIYDSPGGRSPTDNPMRGGRGKGAPVRANPNSNPNPMRGGRSKGVRPARLGTRLLVSNPTRTPDRHPPAASHLTLHVVSSRSRIQAGSGRALR